HPREGDVALLDYSVSKGPELSNPMDANSEPTGNTTFVVDEYYESPAGIARHWQDTTENWPEMSSAAPAWFAKATIVTLHNGTVVQGTLGRRSTPSAAKSREGDDSVPKAKELIADGISVVINCESCMQWHIEQAARAGASQQEMLEAVEVAMEM